MGKLPILFVFLFCVLSCSPENKPSGEKEPIGVSEKYDSSAVRRGENQTVDYGILRNEDGSYGYEIKINGVVKIRQKHIPCITGVLGFISEDDAKKCAHLASRKILQNVFPPSISIEELDSMKIHY